MDVVEIIVLSFALALDAFIVSFSYGAVMTVNRLKNAFLLAFSFGFFQFLMPIIGWHFTDVVYEYLKYYSKWIVFLVFLVLGMKFLAEVFSKEKEQRITCLSNFCIFVLAIATSVDAFGAGVSIKFLNTSIIPPSVTIGCITFVLSFIGFYLAGLFNKMPSKYISLVGAILLFYLAVKSII